VAGQGSSSILPGRRVLSSQGPGGLSFSINSWTGRACSLFGVYDVIEKQSFQLNRGLFI
jgi:hypothetical protein